MERSRPLEPFLQSVSPAGRTALDPGVPTVAVLRPNAMLRAALDYARLGWSVFPCHPRAKTPLTEHGVKNATIDEWQIREWWTRWPDANIGVATGAASGFFALDVDERAGVSGNDTLARLEHEHGKLPVTVEQHTPSGGRHLLFRANGLPIRNSAGKLGPGLDGRGDGGYIVVCPSIGQDGARYRWQDSALPSQTLIADAPQWLLDKLAEPKSAPSQLPSAHGDPTPGQPSAYAEAALDDEWRAVARLKKGTRNDTLNKAAFSLGQLVATGLLTQERVESALLDAATRCGLVADDGEAAARATIKSGMDAGEKDPRNIPGRANAVPDPQASAPSAGEASVVDEDKEIARLAKLTPLAYERERKTAAERLGISRLGVLDAAVKAARGGAGDAGQGRPLVLPTPEPWAEPVDGAALLDKISALFLDFIIMPVATADMIALWTVHAHALDASEYAPSLRIRSPSKRCGKTHTLTIVLYLVPRALPASNISPSALFRTIEAAQPTLLIDEAETFLKDSEEARGLLNSSHYRPLAFVVRNVGDNHEPRSFSTWAAVAMASIGSLPDTIEDRSLTVMLQRKKKGETVHRFLAALVAERAVPLASQAARWTADNLSSLNGASPEMPPGLNDRAENNWEPLLAIADRAGGDWPRRARAAALALSGDGVVEDDNVGTMLLADIHRAFAEKNVDRLSSVVLVEYLATLDERPWPEWKHGKPITKTQLAHMLVRYGISSRTIRLDDGTTAKGYKREAFADAFERYLAPTPPLQNVTPSQPKQTAALRPISKRHTDDVVTFRKTLNPGESATCDGVTFQNPLSGESTGIDLDEVNKDEPPLPAFLRRAVKPREVKI